MHKLSKTCREIIHSHLWSTMESPVENSPKIGNHGLMLVPVPSGSRKSPGQLSPAPNNECTGRKQPYNQHNHWAELSVEREIDLASPYDISHHAHLALPNANCLYDTCLTNPYTSSSDTSMLPTSLYDDGNILDSPLDLDLNGPTASASWGDKEAPVITTEASSILEPRSTRVRTKFSKTEDQLIILLRRKGRTWKEISQQLPGRSSGTLQVRYSTKLKSAAVKWTNNLV